MSTQDEAIPVLRLDEARAGDGHFDAEFLGRLRSTAHDVGFSQLSDFGAVLVIDALSRDQVGRQSPPDTSNRHLHFAVRQDIRRPLPAHLLDLVERLVHCGNRAGVKASVVAVVIPGAYLARYTHQGQPDGAWIAEVIRTVWPGLTTH